LTSLLLFLAASAAVTVAARSIAPGSPLPAPTLALAVTRPSCVGGTVVVEPAYIRFDLMRSHSYDEPLFPSDAEPLKGTDAPTLTGLSHRLPTSAGALDRLAAWQSSVDPMSVELLGPHIPLDGLTLTAFLRSGGVLVKEVPTTGVDAQRIRSELGPRAQIVTIGKQEAALVVGDEVLGTGHRQVGVFWSDGTADWSMVGSLARVTPDALLTVAATLYC
jgi:hypothetical protein